MDDVMMRKKALGGVKMMAGEAMGRRLMKQPAPATVTVSVSEPEADEEMGESEADELARLYESEMEG